MKKTLTGDYIISYLTLLSGLSISAVAIYYSVIGLISIFSAAVIPIMIMGIVLEVSKLIASIWVKRHWEDGPTLLKSFFIIAIFVFMFITSMGIYGFLAKAHSDQTLVSGDVLAKIAIYDEKITTAKENIDANRMALKQMDAAVDQIMGRTTDEKGAKQAVAIRKTQQKERNLLLEDIETEQKKVAILSEERAPIAAEVRKVEAEVGPIKYIAALIYGDNPDTSILERAVSWIIILIVSVFDPMAIMLLLASQYSFKEIYNTKDTENNFQELKPVMSEIVHETIIEQKNNDVNPSLDEIQPVFTNSENMVNVTTEEEQIWEEFFESIQVLEGDRFPENPIKGNTFRRMDFNPPKNFLFNGVHWINIE